MFHLHLSQLSPICYWAILKYLKVKSNSVAACPGFCQTAQCWEIMKMKGRDGPLEMNLFAALRFPVLPGSDSRGCCVLCLQKQQGHYSCLMAHFPTSACCSPVAWRCTLISLTIPSSLSSLRPPATLLPSQHVWGLLPPLPVCWVTHFYNLCLCFLTCLLLFSLCSLFSLSRFLPSCLILL